MCKEDVRIARKTVPNSYFDDTVANAGTLRLKANPNRFSLSIVMNTTDESTINGSTIVYAYIGGKRWPLGAIDKYVKSRMWNIKDVGFPLTGDIYTLDIGTALGDGMIIAETQFLEELEKV